jgi:hypothetical protein
MFSLFKKSDGVNVVDKVWMSKQAKWKACSAMFALNPSSLFVAWFEETADELGNHLGLPSGKKILVLASDLTADAIQDRMVMFVEHYPLSSVEQDLFKKLNLKEVPVLLSLDEPFFQKFGGEKTIELMKKLGVKEDEVLGNAMIGKSIRNAQEKIAEKVKSEKKARSQEEWMKVNVNRSFI